MNTDGSHKIDLTEYVMRSFSPARIIRSHRSSILGMDYSHTGSKLVCGSGGASVGAISVIDTFGNGSETKRIPVRKYGAGVLKFFQDTNADGSICVTSTNDSTHTIRSLELSKYTYSRTFKGHTSQVISLSTSPINSEFISGDVGGKMKLWDVREKSSVGYLNTQPYTRGRNGNNGNNSGNGNVHSECYASYDPKGVIFGVLNGNVVKLYDCKKYSQGPFVEFPVLSVGDTNGTGNNNGNGNVSTGNNNNGNGNFKASQATSLKFSSDGEYFLVVFRDAYSPENSCIKVFDAYKGNISRTFYVPTEYNQGVSMVESSFSSDAKFVLAGSSNGSVYCWDLLNDKLVSRTDNFHSGDIGTIAFNPTLAQYATACQNVAIWVPHPNSSQNSNPY